jgi:hypothetical protein
MSKSWRPGNWGRGHRPPCSACTGSVSLVDRQLADLCSYARARRRGALGRSLGQRLIRQCDFSASGRCKTAGRRFTRRRAPHRHMRPSASARPTHPRLCTPVKLSATKWPQPSLLVPRSSPHPATSALLPLHPVADAEQESLARRICLPRQPDFRDTRSDLSGVAAARIRVSGPASPPRWLAGPRWKAELMRTVRACVCFRVGS